MPSSKRIDRVDAMSIGGIEPELHEWLREQATEHGVSVEEEVRSLLRSAPRATPRKLRSGATSRRAGMRCSPSR